MRSLGVAAQRWGGLCRLQRQCTVLLLWGSRSSGRRLLLSGSQLRLTRSGCRAARELQVQGLRPEQMGQPLPH